MPAGSLIGKFAVWFIVAAFGLTRAEAGSERDQGIMLTGHNNHVRLLNVTRDVSIDTEAMKKAADQIAALLHDEKLVPTRVEISADHPVVREALTARTMEIAIAGTPPILVLVPLSHDGNRIILKQGHAPDENYALFALPPDAGVNLKACFR